MDGFSRRHEHAKIHEICCTKRLVFFVAFESS